MFPIGRIVVTVIIVLLFVLLVYRSAGELILDNTDRKAVSCSFSDYTIIIGISWGEIRTLLRSGILILWLIIILFENKDVELMMNLLKVTFHVFILI